ncbi:MAG TPA: hypothetical protein VFN55_09340 [Solirubrobacteraceae bacterium]|nr:hypothetical protein [Solirubrobacteraceae bacterium]
MRIIPIRKFLVGGVVALAVSGAAAATASATYGPGAQYQVELSANIPGSAGGGLWLWISLNANGTGDYSGADCGHGGGGAASDKGDVKWTPVGSSIVITGVTLNGFGGFPTTITIPAAYGHHTGTVGSYLTLPLPPPVLSAGFSQLQVAP